MKISYNWLKEYIDLDISPDELSTMLTDCGLEVEELVMWQNIHGGLEGVVTAEVLEVRKHSNADKLSVTKVNLGSGEPVQIVCGAPNVAKGQKVLVATVGATLFRDEQPFEIKQARIRGEESSGMICAEDELGIGQSHEGIMVLPSDVPPGIPAKEYFQVTTDWIFTIGLTPNRVDAASHIGVAIDVAARLNMLSGKKIRVSKPDLSDFSVDNHDLPVEIIIRDTEACPRYSGLTLNNIKTGPSPQWLAGRLTAAGMRPINNIVDITNFVMLELGHPLHAFDMKHVKGKKVIIQKFENPHEFVTLDGVTRTIHPEDLMICNSDKGMCIAGVFGGFESGVTDDTTAIFLESAYFNPVSVRKTSNRHALKTESSFRFERGTDPSVTVTALKRAALLLKEIAGAEISSPVYDVYPKSIEKAQITFTHEFINVSLGHSIPAETQLSILRDLEFEIISVEEQTVTVLAPHAKVDVTRPADVVEEILRIYGYNNIPFSETHKTGLTFGAKYDEHNIRNIFSEMLTANGFFEIMTNSLSSDRYYSQEFGFNAHENVKLLNPLSNELNTMRRTLLFSGMESVVHNINRKQLDLSFFEFGKVYSCISADKNLQVTNRYNEETHLALLMTGTVFPLNWLYPEEKITFFHLKNQVQQILHRAGISESDINTEETKLPIFSYGLSYSLKKSEKALVHAGEVSRRVLEMTECRQQVFYAEIMWDNLFEFITGQHIQAVEPPRFPEVHRDIALLLDKNIPYSQIRDIIIGKGGELLKTVRLFDVYEGKNIPEGKKSYAINIILQDSSKTLPDKETDGILEAMKTSFVQTLGAIIR